MKYVVSFVIGLLSGALLYVVGSYYNPFAGQAKLSPLAVSDTSNSRLSYSAVPSKMILFSNDGESVSQPHPGKVAELWEPTIRDSRLIVTRLADSRGAAAGIGIKISTPSESTQLFRSEMLIDSVWHLYLPGRGTLGIYQQENYWAYIRDIVVSAWRNSSDSWRGNWTRDMTAGPGSLNTAIVTGLGGEFEGMEGEAVEALNARAYSLDQGPVSMVGTLSIAMPDQTNTSNAALTN